MFVFTMIANVNIAIEKPQLTVRKVMSIKLILTLYLFQLRIFEILHPLWRILFGEKVREKYNVSFIKMIYCNQPY
jgi:hypothetical protein